MYRGISLLPSSGTFESSSAIREHSRGDFSSEEAEGKLKRPEEAEAKLKRPSPDDEAGGTEGEAKVPCRSTPADSTAGRKR